MNYWDGWNPRFSFQYVLFIHLTHNTCERTDQSYDSVNHQQWLTWNSRLLSQCVTGKHKIIDSPNCLQHDFLPLSHFKVFSKTMCRALIDSGPWMLIFMILDDGDSFVKACYLDCAGRPRSRRGRWSCCWTCTAQHQRSRGTKSSSWLRRRSPSRRWSTLHTIRHNHLHRHLLTHKRQDNAVVIIEGVVLWNSLNNNADFRERSCGRGWGSWRSERGGRARKWPMKRLWGRSALWRSRSISSTRSSL